MTDLEKFIDLYKQFGIEMKTKEEEQNIVIILGDSYSDFENATTNDKITGYRGFFSEIKFTKEGAFVEQGFYE